MENYCVVCNFPIAHKYKGNLLCPNHILYARHMESGKKDFLYFQILKDRKFITWFVPYYYKKE